jgi:hypothetical protein
VYKDDAHSLYEILRDVSARILKRIGAHTEPHAVAGRGKTRTCQFLEVDGQRRYRGILFHFTADASMIGALRWANHVGWGNEVSSWHTQIADRINDDVVGEEWVKLDKEVLLLFPVPTVILADHRWGTWHGNWTCNVTLGVENRNLGPSVKSRILSLGKEPFQVGTSRYLWEPYTREQIICNINYGRMANALINDRMDPDWILSHQCVWASKWDTGPHFPMHAIREAILDSKRPLTYYGWLSTFELAPDEVTIVDDEMLAAADGAPPENSPRIESEEDFVAWVRPSREVLDKTNPVLNLLAYDRMRRLGFNVGQEFSKMPHHRFVKMVKWWQRSSGAYRRTEPSRVLDPDGVVGPNTDTFGKRRLEGLGF